MPRRYRSSPVAVTHFSPLYADFHNPSGCGGITDGPYIFLLKRPDTARASSRINSASSRNRGPWASSRFDGSRFNRSGVTFADCLYVADITIALRMPFVDQPR